jgi:hypothetical protein
MHVITEASAAALSGGSLSLSAPDNVAIPTHAPIFTWPRQGIDL